MVFAGRVAATVLAGAVFAATALDGLALPATALAGGVLTAALFFYFGFGDRYCRGFACRAFLLGFLSLAASRCGAGFARVGGFGGIGDGNMAQSVKAVCAKSTVSAFFQGGAMVWVIFIWQ